MELRRAAARSYAPPPAPGLSRIDQNAQETTTAQTARLAWISRCRPGALPARRAAARGDGGRAERVAQHPVPDPDQQVDAPARGARGARQLRPAGAGSALRRAPALVVLLARRAAGLAR